MGACRPQRSSRSQLLVRNCVGCMLISGIPGHKVVRVAGRTIPTQPVPPEFPGTYPTGFYEAAMGDKLPNHKTFSSEFRSSLDKILKTKAPQEYDEFMQTGTCNSRQHQWVVLRFPANTYFPVHAHPGRHRTAHPAGVLRMQLPPVLSHWLHTRRVAECSTTLMHGHLPVQAAS
jgi:hypothetical protein